MLSTVRTGLLLTSVAVAAVALALVSNGCLTRPVSTQPPLTKTNFTALVDASPVDKIDLLFMIDNSESMGDKQQILKAAVPALLTRLVQPNCLTASGSLIGRCMPDAMGGCACPTGKIEFPPVHDMHIGIVTSSLGGLGSDECPEPAPNPVNPAVDTHNNDHGELINRSDPTGNQSEVPVADAVGNGQGVAGMHENFLAWLPPVPANANKPAPPVNPIQYAPKLIAELT